MRIKTQLLFFSFTAAIAYCVASSFVPDRENPSEKVYTLYMADFQVFEEWIQKYRERAEAEVVNIEELRTVHRRTREAFKRLEPLWELHDPQGVKDFINGAPLPSFERNSPSLSVLEPQGLQVLDELLYADNPLVHLDEIREQVELLGNSVRVLKEFERKRAVYDTHVFQALRMNMVRLMSLGISSFDTPGSLNGIAEATVNMEVLRRYIQIYKPIIPAEQRPRYREILRLSEEGKEYLRSSSDFETFNRFEFIQKWINPLYAALLDLQLALGIETPEERPSLPQPWNYKSRTVFSSEFLDPYYYAGLTREEDNAELRQLGEDLFFDPILSADNKRSCASCHRPVLAFTDGVKKSPAFQAGETVQRNSMSLVNAVYAEKYFWDLRAGDLAQQIDHVVFSDKEFNTSYDSIISKLNNSGYESQFAKAFPSQKNIAINKNKITSAISSFLISLTSFESEFDKGINGELELEAEVIDGFNLFMGKANCGSCHFAPTFAGLIPPDFRLSETEVLGVPTLPDTISATADSDMGRYANGNIKERADHTRHSFKTVSVRNVSMTEPYMHNGVYETLEEVMDFYNRGGGAGIGARLPNQTLGSEPLDLSEEEIEKIIAFMESLGDLPW